MPKSKVENDIVEKQKIISSLTLMDDLFMKVVLQDKECTEYILQTIMDDSSLKLKRQSLQKIYRISMDILWFRLPLRR